MAFLKTEEEKEERKKLEKLDKKRQEHDERLIKNKLITNIRKLFEQEQEEYNNWFWKSDAWKIQLTIEINLIYSKDGEEECALHSNSGNIKFTPYSDANDVIDELLEVILFKISKKVRNINESNWLYSRFNWCIKNVIK